MIHTKLYRLTAINQSAANHF